MLRRYHFTMIDDMSAEPFDPRDFATEREAYHWAISLAGDRVSLAPDIVEAGESLRVDVRDDLGRMLFTIRLGLREH